ncbi:ZinT/AdcA family metal-binding protein, partial [Streptococcus pneumoniae]
HNVAPVKAEHFHIFFGGTSQEALFEEMDNWPIRASRFLGTRWLTSL